MKTKLMKLAMITCVMILALPNAYTETITLYVSVKTDRPDRATLILTAGESAELHSAQTYTQYGHQLILSNAVGNMSFFLPYSPSVFTNAAARLKVAGPAEISLVRSYSDANAILMGYATFEVTRGSATTVPSNVVVIPEDAGGNVEIVLESSSDLVNWTAANPGSYGTSTQKRFFRVRAIRQPQ